VRPVLEQQGHVIAEPFCVPLYETFPQSLHSSRSPRCGDVLGGTPANQVTISTISKHAVQEARRAQEADVSGVQRCQRATPAHGGSREEELLHRLLIGIGAQQHVFDLVQRHPV